MPHMDSVEMWNISADGCTLLYLKRYTFWWLVGVWALYHEPGVWAFVKSGVRMFIRARGLSHVHNDRASSDPHVSVVPSLMGPNWFSLKVEKKIFSQFKHLKQCLLDSLKLENTEVTFQVCNNQDNNINVEVSKV